MLNKVCIIGNCGRDPEVRVTTGGESVCNFSVAVNESWKGKDGTKQERTEWFTVDCWGKLAELCGQYVHKGDRVYVEGSLRTDEYEKDGVKKQRVKIVARQVLFLTPKSGGSSMAAPAGQDEGGVPF